MMGEPPPIRATARLQFHKGFTLDDAIGIVPYLERLGISHVYASPLLTARPGSTHGYDIVDHGTINPELGGASALKRLVDALRARRMGLILDIVPNHMGVGGSDNAWWLDVLEWGQGSPYAAYFDIDWTAPEPELRGKLLAPFLGDAYGTCLASGDIALRLDAAEGRIDAWYYEHRFPLAPPTYPIALGESEGPLATALSAFQRLPRAARVARREAGVARAGLARLATQPAQLAEINRRLAAIGPERLHALLEQQHYRLAHWRTAADETNWRRFFDISSLAGLRVEVPAVFDATHRLILPLFHDGLIDGVRIDHVDGLADPHGYCRKLRRRLEVNGRRAYIIVEKILAPRERLPRAWQTDGTTGYDFMDLAGGVLIDPAGEAPLQVLWHEATGESTDFAVVEHLARRQILRDYLGSELGTVAFLLHRIARADTVTRDMTYFAIRRALIELLVHFPVYRIYTGLAGSATADAHVMARAAAAARRTIRRADRPLLDLIVGWLDGSAARQLPPGAERRARKRAMVRFQQLSSPVAAKSVEDTAFYRLAPLLSRNEVGSHPGHPAALVATFHAEMRHLARHFPNTMLATATHDHKRGEDTRARMAVLSEMPEAWAAAIQRWMRLNAPLRRQLETGPAPDPVDELMLYQTLVAAWPPDLEPHQRDRVDALCARVAAWQEKALREAKRHSEWAAPNQEYEAAARQFLEHVLDPARPARLVDEIAAFAHSIGPAGALNGLTQTLLRLTAPGIPDLYQGTELWDFSLVDPDNRREVDFAARTRLLDRMASPQALLRQWQDGAIKQAIIARALALRARLPRLFAQGGYRSLTGTGQGAPHVIGFTREVGDAVILVAATRQAVALLGDARLPHVPRARWRESTLALPATLQRHAWRDVLSDKTHVPARSLRVAELFAELPVALLVAGQRESNLA